MTTYDRINEILKKTRMSWEKLGLKTGIATKRIQVLKDGREQFTTDELSSICSFFGESITLDYLIRGIDYSGEIASYIKGLKPSNEQYIEDFLAKCEEVIMETGLMKYKDLLIPKFYSNWKEKREINNYKPFQGGIFLFDEYFHYQEIYKPYIDLKKLIALDNYEIFSKLKNYPRTNGQMRHLLKINKNDEGLKTLSNFGSSSDFGREIDVPKLRANDIFSSNEVTQIEFFEEIINAEDWDPSTALYFIKESNPNYWNIVKLYLNHGAYLTKEGKKDVIKTMMLKRVAGIN